MPMDWIAPSRIDVEILPETVKRSRSNLSTTITIQLSVCVILKTIAVNLFVFKTD